MNGMHDDEQDQAEKARRIAPLFAWKAAHEVKTKGPKAERCPGVPGAKEFARMMARWLALD